VSRRGDGQLQVGLDPDQRAVVPDRDPVRRLLRDLDHGVDPTRVDPELRVLLAALVDRGLARAADEPAIRRRLRAAARVAVLAPETVHPVAVGMLSAAGLTPGSFPDAGSAATLVVTVGAEPRRELLDREMRADRVHLPVTTLAGRVRVGPIVVPGLTACVRCVDEHHADRDPRHALVLEQHHAPEPRDEPAEEDLQLGLAWAARDLAGWVDGARPVTWSATVELCEGAPPVTRTWRRHPRCGCAWGDALAG
jgi:hypothetical protein